MDKIFILIAFIAMGGVVVSLSGGLLAMAKGGKKNNAASQRMMRFRIICQGVAVGALLLAYLL